jgi:hypothetical protein
MKGIRNKTLANLLKDDRGQVLPWVTVMLVCLIGVTALVVDLGHVMICFRELQAGTNAAALAGAQELPASDYSTVAQQYSSASGQYNAVAGNLPIVGTTITGVCLTTVKSWGIPCSAPADDNAVIVTQTATVPTYFARVLGINSVNLSATATAASRGSLATPYNVAIIVDTTESMNSTDSDSQCNSSRLACALSGVQTLLANMAPCPYSLTSCGSVTSGSNGAGNVSNGIDHVSLFTFPNATQSTMPDDYDCTGSNPTIQSYTFPTAGASSYAPSSSTATYQVVNFSSDFKTSAGTSSLSGTSNLVKSVGGKSNCTGMAAPGGEGTYYAGVIYAAQAALEAEQAIYPSAGNVMILISDGDASEQAKGMTGASATSGVYPSYVKECQQAVTAAQAAAAAGTRIYTVAYGAESSGCTGESLTPCETMKGIASSTSYFYSDYQQSGSGDDTSCIGTADSTTNLNQIFTDIAGDLTTARLIPNGLP